MSKRIAKVLRLVRNSGLWSTVVYVYRWMIMRKALEYQLHQELKVLNLIFKNPKGRPSSNVQGDVDAGAVAIVVPWFEFPFGGIKTIYRFAEALRRETSLRPVIIVYSSDFRPLNKTEIIDSLSSHVPNLSQDDVVIFGVDPLNQLWNAVIATAWESVYLIESTILSRIQHKYYFIQDYESGFYPAGAIQGAVENTYTMGYKGIVNSKGLFEFLKSEYGIEGTYFNPGVDHSLFYPDYSRREVKTPTIFFYARPSITRNGFSMGLSVLKEIKLSHSDVRIISAGESWRPASFGVDGIVENLGRLTFEETAKIYRQVDIALVLMYTQHTSYIPLEVMASGGAIVSNWNVSKTWILKHEENCLLGPATVAGLSALVIRLIEDPELRQRLQEQAIAITKHLRWASSFSASLNWLENDLLF